MSKRLTAKVFPHGMSPLVGVLPLLEQSMTTLPQHVTSRYAYRLALEGHNDIFELVKTDRRESIVDGIVTGRYYEVTIIKRNLAVGPNSYTAIGVTPRQAIKRVLERAGVTFK